MENTSSSNFINLLKTIIRYFASGFIFIIAFKYLNGETDIWTFTTEKINWSIILFAAICGLFIYTFHAALLDDVFYKLSLKYLKHKKNRSSYWPQKFESTPYNDIMFSLTTYRYERAGAKKRKSKAVQDRIDQLLMMLVLLYTSSFSLIILPLALLLYNFSSGQAVAFSTRFILIFILGLLFCGMGFILDVKITRRELFMVKQKESDNIC
jgi:hypothetical protein